MDSLNEELSKWISNKKKEAISFLQEIIQIPSPSGLEKDLANFLYSKMLDFGYDFSKINETESVMGVIRGNGKGRDLLMNGHIDHVPTGDMIDPFSGKVIDGKEVGVEGKVVYGRAASDMKGAVAAMIMAGAALTDLGINLSGDYKIAGVTQEEVGGAGTLSTIQDDHFLGDVIVVGEATNMDLALGHRGSMKMSVIVKGKSCHASAPERGVNALYKALEMIKEIRSDLIDRLPSHQIYGKTSLAITQIEVWPKALNVVPEKCEFSLDCRNTPNFSSQDLKNELDRIIKKLQSVDPDFQAMVMPTPILMGRRGFTGFYTEPKKFQVVEEISQIIETTLNKELVKKTWTFATDGRFYSWLGLPVIGFGPGEERFAHTDQDHVKVVDYLDSIKTYAMIGAKICGSK
jgi:acetylornithine deacetylase/succinyl-diaminopimelate desuccinylase family protein